MFDWGCFLIFANICHVYTQEFYCMPLMQVTFHLQWVQVIALLIHCFNSHTQFSLINENSFAFIFAITCRVKRLIFFPFCLSLEQVLSGACLWHIECDLYLNCQKSKITLLLFLKLKSHETCPLRQDSHLSRHLLVSKDKTLIWLEVGNFLLSSFVTSNQSLHEQLYFFSATRETFKYRHKIFRAQPW